MKTIFSGIQPSGSIHVGNYIGAIRQWVDLQNSTTQQKHIFCIVDLHAITVPQEPNILKSNVRSLAILYLACGIDPARSIFFLQSQNPHHPYASWLLGCVTPTGWLNRMIQYKEKAGKHKESASVGLYTYPILMATDILLYNTNYVPVGYDQVQHVEITKDIARKYNRTYGEILTIPEVMIDKKSARIMSLNNPAKKMSKSDNNQNSVVYMLDDPDSVASKVMKAVTDSGEGIEYDLEKKPALSNLITIYARLSNSSIKSVVDDCKGLSYKEFKERLTEVINDTLRPIQKEYHRLKCEEAYIDSLLKEGLRKAMEISGNTVNTMISAMGLGFGKKIEKV